MVICQGKNIVLSRNRFQKSSSGGKPPCPLLCGGAGRFFNVKKSATQKRCSPLPTPPLSSSGCRGLHPRTPRPCFSRNKGFVSYGAWGGDPRAGICVHFLPHHRERMEQGNASVASRRLRPARVCLRSLNCEPVRISSKMRMIRMQALAGEDGYPAGIRSRCRGGTFPPCHSCRYCPVIVGMTGLS